MTTERARACAELRLLACIAPLGRAGVAMAREAGVREDDFSQPDTRAVFMALSAAAIDTGMGVTLAAKLVRASLRTEGLYTSGDARRFLGPTCWGAGMIAAMFWRIDKSDAEAALPGLAAEVAGRNGAIDAIFAPWAA
jgi:hypothetical protein